MTIEPGQHTARARIEPINDSRCDDIFINRLTAARECAIEGSPISCIYVAGTTNSPSAIGGILASYFKSRTTSGSSNESFIKFKEVYEQQSSFLNQRLKYKNLLEEANLKVSEKRYSDTFKNQPTRQSDEILKDSDSQAAKIEKNTKYITRIKKQIFDHNSKIISRDGHASLDVHQELVNREVLSMLKNSSYIRLRDFVRQNISNSNPYNAFVLEQNSEHIKLMAKLFGPEKDQIKVQSNAISKAVKGKNPNLVKELKDLEDSKEKAYEALEKKQKELQNFRDNHRNVNLEEYQDKIFTYDEEIIDLKSKLIRQKTALSKKEMELNRLVEAEKNAAIAKTNELLPGQNNLDLVRQLEARWVNSPQVADKLNKPNVAEELVGKSKANSKLTKLAGGVADGSVIEAPLVVGAAVAQARPMVCAQELNLSDVEAELIRPNITDPNRAVVACKSLRLSNPLETLRNAKDKFGGIPKGLCDLAHQELAASIATISSGKIKPATDADTCNPKLELEGGFSIETRDSATYVTCPEQDSKTNFYIPFVNRSADFGGNILAKTIDPSGTERDYDSALRRFKSFTNGSAKRPGTDFITPTSLRPLNKDELFIHFSNSQYIGSNTNDFYTKCYNASKQLAAMSAIRKLSPTCQSQQKSGASAPPGVSPINGIK